MQRRICGLEDCADGQAAMRPKRSGGVVRSYDTKVRLADGGSSTSCMHRIQRDGLRMLRVFDGFVLVNSPPNV